MLILFCFAISCNGSKSSSSSDISNNAGTSTYFISSVDLSNEIVYTDSIIDISYTMYGKYPSGLIANWKVDAGNFITQTPDIWQQVRGVRAANTSAIGEKVTLMAPSNTCTIKVTITLNDEFQTHLERDINVYATPLKIVSTTDNSSGNLLLTAKTSNVTDLYQIAFRVIFDPSKYEFTKVNAGNFFSSNERLFLGHQVDDTTIAVAVTLKGAVRGKSGSGEIATVFLKPIVKNASASYLVSVEAARNPEGGKVL